MPYTDSFDKVCYLTETAAAVYLIAEKPIG